MGMAAGQARLLSITARLSDNELRAQIINNNKMRLATESSQVSEAYIAALNEAQLMYTSYDKDNNASYQKLTFNALTAYNPYNNQYALTNTGGQVLISELDARNYEACGGDLNEFLLSYGLENSTNYFDVLENVSFASEIYDDAGNPYDPAQYNGFVYGNPPDVTPLMLTGEDLKKLFEGADVDLNDGKVGSISRSGSDTMSAYDVTAASNLMYEYEKYMDLYTETYTDYLNMTASVMQNKLLEMLGSAFEVTINDNSTLDDIFAKLSGGTGDFSKIYALLTGSNFTNYLVSDASNHDTEIGKYFENLKDRVQGYMSGAEISTYSYDTSAPGPEVEVKNGNDIVGVINKSTNQFSFLDSYNDAGDAVYTNPIMFDDGSGSTKYHYVEGAGYAAGEADDGSYITVTKNDTDGTVTISEHLPNDFNYTAAAKNILNEISAAIMNIWDANKEAWLTTDIIKEKYNEYLKNAYELAKIIYGEDRANQIISQDSSGNYSINGTGDTLETNKQIIGNLGDIVALYNNHYIDEEHSGYGAFTDDFKQVFANLLLDMVMDTYGEPKYTWIDKTNPNENGEAKAKWYTNLFELIEKNGYKTLLDGLASSNEWMQFAFENGIVQMKQVDEHNAWNNIIYSNCADITEQTDDKAIAIAEAEYNAAMNKIENKDKRYDLELKNIDTEHNSLQVEYDSIKTAIDKNIERNFKLYS